MLKIHLLANTKSGRGMGGSLADLAQKLCQEAGCELINHEIKDPSDLDEQTEKAIQAAKADDGIVVAAGGDGTIRSVAEKVQGQDIRFGVIPCGTFNFFARTHQIPEDHADAIRVIIAGKSKPVRLGEINGRIFLINASMGLYAKAIRDREKRTSRFGRHQLVVIISTILSLIEGHKLLDVDMNIDGQKKSLRTPMIFIGNNALQLRDLSMNVARCMKQDLMALVTMRPLKKWEMVRVIFRGFSKTLEREDAVDSACVDAVTIRTHRKTQTVALDGELFSMSSPFEVRTLPGVLNLVGPSGEIKAP